MSHCDIFDGTEKLSEERRKEMLDCDLKFSCPFFGSGCHGHVAPGPGPRIVVKEAQGES